MFIRALCMQPQKVCTYCICRVTLKLSADSQSEFANDAIFVNVCQKKTNKKKTDLSLAVVAQVSDHVSVSGEKPKCECFFFLSLSCTSSI